MDRQHSLTTRFVSMVSVMNIHGRRIVPLVNTLDDLYQAMVLDRPSRDRIPCFLESGIETNNITIRVRRLPLSLARAKYQNDAKMTAGA